jgi:hypothetical protein
VAGAGNDHGRRERKHPLGERRAERQHLQHLVAAAGEDLQVEPGGEVALPASEHDDGVVLRRLIEGAMDGPQHRYRERVDLPIVHRDRRDPAFELIAHQFGHRHLPVVCASAWSLRAARAYTVAMFRNNVLKALERDGAAASH